MAGRTMNRYRWALAGLVLAIGAGGCSQMNAANPAPVTQPATAQANPCETADELDFIDCMAGQAKCSFGQAVRAVAMFIDPQAAGTDFSQNYAFLAERGVVRPAWAICPEEWIDRGTLSYMLYQAMGLRGGVNMVLFGSWGLGERRYAYRELLYRNLVQEGVDYGYVSGPELIATLGKVDNLMLETGRYTPENEVQLGEKPQNQQP